MSGSAPPRLPEWPAAMVLKKRLKAGAVAQ